MTVAQAAELMDETALLPVTQISVLLCRAYSPDRAAEYLEGLLRHGDRWLAKELARVWWRDEEMVCIHVALDALGEAVETAGIRWWEVQP